jgi:hypothetical protein
MKILIEDNIIICKNVFDLNCERHTKTLVCNTIKRFIEEFNDYTIDKFDLKLYFRNFCEYISTLNLDEVIYVFNIKFYKLNDYIEIHTSFRLNDLSLK